MQNIGKAHPFYPGRQPSDSVAVLVLLANTEQHFNVPTSATVAVFSATDNFFALVNGQTAAVPAVTSTSFPSPNTVPEINPTVLAVVAGTKVSVISVNACTVVICFYKDTSTPENVGTRQDNKFP